MAPEGRRLSRGAGGPGGPDEEVDGQLAASGEGAEGWGTGAHGWPWLAAAAVQGKGRGWTRPVGQARRVRAERVAAFLLPGSRNPMWYDTHLSKASLGGGGNAAPVMGGGVPVQSHGTASTRRSIHRTRPLSGPKENFAWRGGGTLDLPPRAGDWAAGKCTQLGCVSPTFAASLGRLADSAPAAAPCLACLPWPPDWQCTRANISAVCKKCRV